MGLPVHYAATVLAIARYPDALVTQMEGVQGMGAEGSYENAEARENQAKRLGSTRYHGPLESSKLTLVTSKVSFCFAALVSEIFVS